MASFSFSFARKAAPTNWAALVKAPPGQRQPSQAAAAAAAAAAPLSKSGASARRPVLESPPPEPLCVSEDQWLEQALAALGPSSKASASPAQLASAQQQQQQKQDTAEAEAAANALWRGLACRGMVNTGNTCYRLAVLQSLLACAPLAEAVLARPARRLLAAPAAAEHVPTWTALAQFWREFWGIGAANAGKAVNPQDTLRQVLGSFRGAVAGEQEDAEEFLAYFLGKLHDEVERLVKKQAKDAEQHAVLQQAAVDDEWQEVGRGGVAAVVNRQAEARAAAVESVITRVFHGTLRSEASHTSQLGRAPLSVMVEPFHCLQLPVPPPDAPPARPPAGGSYRGAPHRPPPLQLEAMLAAFFGGEVLEGVRGGGRGVVRAQRQSALESLPRVLTLQLKQYAFHRAHGTALRTGRPIAYPLELRIPDAHLGAKARSDAAKRGRTYRLFAVVLHYGAAGAAASSGHYTALVRRGGGGGGGDVWYDCDDRVITPIDEADVLSPRHAHGAAPYLLFYQRQLPA
ncbi:hypothetical protein JKP88DRAFT_354191 [Tribonema minus]|uniref:USP domain-containing protein n=1 Tax=Tribonema minus TaxID=303371 RepID=A0A836CGA5_9STRA|nr:hypothetical protein JKP88DRAFT_354191 [Tribonema minus]